MTPETVLELAQVFRDAADRLDAVFYGAGLLSLVPSDAFLGDPYSKWVIEEFNDYFFVGTNSFAHAVQQIAVEHKRTFNALKATADSYGQTDEWNARNLGEAYQLS